MNKVKFLYALVCSMFLAACSEEENLMPAGQTGIQVALTEKASVETRKTPEELTKPLAKEFHLKINKHMLSLRNWSKFQQLFHLQKKLCYLYLLNLPKFLQDY